ncbi:hypothetical protein GR204_19175 [Rhizobium leguminosarum]|uniref:Uncharacterized protein n=1 Tax=Rhizobium leguminosarum TaxID=384 RepID=A0A6P0B859_RHILE|nr:hypothetical protein [Rhizobium leguminosarum]NEI36087.1 hypothetical protein [Rhizobium leguminosarum]NEI45466.1 hypothetical protein [Rhizobium leguminosarum]
MDGPFGLETVTIMALVRIDLIILQPRSNCQAPILSADRLFATQSGLLLRKMYTQALALSRIFHVEACKVDRDLSCLGMTLPGAARSEGIGRENRHQLLIFGELPGGCAAAPALVQPQSSGGRLPVPEMATYRISASPKKRKDGRI